MAAALSLSLVAPKMVLAAQEQVEETEVQETEEVSMSPRLFTPDDVRAAILTGSATARCLITHEVGRGAVRTDRAGRVIAQYAPFDPYSVGAAGEIGPAQLHPRGLLPDFYRQGYDNPNDPFQAVRYIDGALRRNLGDNWTTMAYCR